MDEPMPSGWGEGTAAMPPVLTNGKTAAHQMAEDAARGQLVIDQTNAQVVTPPAVDAFAPHVPPLQRTETTRVVTRTDAPPDPVQQALADLQASDQGQAVINDDFNRRINTYADGFGELARQIRELQARPVASGSTWPDLISRWTSRTWLLPFVSGVATIATTVGATLGSLDPHIAAVSAGVTALFGSIFIAFEKKADGAVRVAQAIQAPAPAPPQAPAHGE